MLRNFEEIETCGWRDMLALTTGLVDLRLDTTDDYLWFHLWIHAKNGREWDGEARLVQAAGYEEEFWACILVEKGTNISSRIGRSGPLMELCRRAAELVHHLVAGEWPGRVAIDTFEGVSPAGTTDIDLSALMVK